VSADAEQSRIPSSFHGAAHCSQFARGQRCRDRDEIRSSYEKAAAQARGGKWYFGKLHKRISLAPLCLFQKAGKVLEKLFRLDGFVFNLCCIQQFS
jgi:hypothetical protein